MAVEAFDGLSREEVLVKFQERRAEAQNPRRKGKKPGKKNVFDFGDLMKLMAIEVKNSGALDEGGSGGGSSMVSAAEMMAIMRMSESIEKQTKETSQASAFGLVGKEVTVKAVKDSDGTQGFLTGTVEDVICVDDEKGPRHLFLINERYYEQQDIVAVSDSAAAQKSQSHEYGSNIKQTQANLKAAQRVINAAKVAQKQAENAGREERNAIKNRVSGCVDQLKKLQENAKAETKRIKERALMLEERLEKLGVGAAEKLKERLEGQVIDLMKAQQEAEAAETQIAEQTRAAEKIGRDLASKYY